MKFQKIYTLLDPLNMGIIYYVRGLMDHPLYKTFYYDIYIEIKYKHCTWEGFKIKNGNLKWHLP